MIQIILASNSPRRKEILSNLGLKFQVIAPEIDENVESSAAATLVEELSFQKACAVFTQLRNQNSPLKDALIIAADTMVVHGLKTLGKPQTPAAAIKMLQRLRNDTHFVLTGITLIHKGHVARCCELTKIHFSDISDKEIEQYVKSGEPMDKAGGYAIQGKAALWIDRIEGDYFNVVGFPIHKFYSLLSEINLSFDDLEKE